MRSDHSPESLTGLSRPPVDIVRDAMNLPDPDHEVGALVIALLGFDAAVTTLAASPSPRAGQVLASVTSWLLVG